MDIERTLSESGVSAALDVHDFKVLRAMRRRLVAEAGLVCPMADAGSALLATLVARAERTVMRVGVVPAGVQRGPRDAMFCSACAHAVLGLACSAPRALVHERFRQLVRSVHPDVCRSPAAEPLTRILVAAHETLKDLVATADRATAAPTEAAGPRETFRAPWWYASLRNAPRPACDPDLVDWFLAQAYGPTRATGCTSEFWRAAAWTSSTTSRASPRDEPRTSRAADFVFAPHWRDRPMPPRDKYGPSPTATDEALGLR